MPKKWTRLVELRKNKNWNQDYCAEKLDVSRNTWSNWENSVFEPDFKTLLEISHLFHISIDYLLGNDDYLVFNENEARILKEAAKIIEDRMK